MRALALCLLFPGLALAQSPSAVDSGGYSRKALTAPGLTLNRPATITGGISTTPLATPTGCAAAVSATAGTLSNATYYYRVAAYNSVGTTLACSEVSRATGGANKAIDVTWSQVTGASGYKVYCRTTAAETLCATITSGSTLTWTDTNAVTPSGALPTVNESGALLSNAASGAAALKLATSGARLYLGSTLYIANDGSNGLVVPTYVSTSYVDAGLHINGSAASIAMRGGAANGATAVGVNLGNNTTLSTAGAKIVRFCAGSVDSSTCTAEAANVDKNGAIRLNINGGGASQPTCDSTIRGTVWYTQGATSVLDKIEICRKDASDVYAWATLL